MRLRFVEDALLELLRNARDAGALNIYVASTRKARRHRTLTVIDDGCGIPAIHKHLIFEAGVTSRHLDPIPYANGNDDVLFHGAGLSLYHIKTVALSAEVFSTACPTAIRVIFDTHILPEKSLQSGSRPSKTNLRATLAKFIGQTVPSPPCLYLGSPAQVLATLLEHHIINRNEGAKRIAEWARNLGLEVSSRTVRRIIAGAVHVADEVMPNNDVTGLRRRVTSRNGAGGPILSLEEEDLGEIFAILRRAARSSYLDLAGLDVEKLPGEVLLRARIYEPEEAYE
ncbi:MAG: ATP-binding protein [Rubrobacter sp.]|nr:ATP-binding protein [Rubrobacter sp.]